MKLPSNIAPLCKAPDCKNGASILSQQGDCIRYMLTCRKHWYGQVPQENKQKEK